MIEIHHHAVKRTVFFVEREVVLPRETSKTTEPHKQRKQQHENNNLTKIFHFKKKE